jgi:hypothetical protein
MVEQSQSEKSHADLEANMDEDVEEEMDQNLTKLTFAGC